MRKIPTLFERDWDGDRSRVLNQVVPGCEWVLDGEGVATRKWDGTCSLVLAVDKDFHRESLHPVVYLWPRGRERRDSGPNGGPYGP